MSHKPNVSAVPIVFGGVVVVIVFIVIEQTHGIRLNRRNVNGVQTDIGYCTIQQINMGIVISVQMG